MKIQSILFLLLAFTTNIVAQNDFSWQLLSPWRWHDITEFKYHDGEIYFFDRFEQELVFFDSETQEFVKTAFTNYHVRDILIVNENEWYLNTSNKLYKSENGGFSWNLVLEYIEAFIPDIFMVQDELFFYFTDGSMYRVENDALTLVKNEIPGDVDWNDLYITYEDEKICYISDDLGVNWTEIDISDRQILLCKKSNKVFSTNVDLEIFEWDNGVFDYINRLEHDWIVNTAYYPLRTVLNIVYDNQSKDITLKLLFFGAFQSSDNGESWNSLYKNQLLAYESRLGSSRIVVDQKKNVIVKDNLGVQLKTPTNVAFENMTGMDLGKDIKISSIDEMNYLSSFYGSAVTDVLFKSEDEGLTWDYIFSSELWDRTEQLSLISKDSVLIYSWKYDNISVCDINSTDCEIIVTDIMEFVRYGERFPNGNLYYENSEEGFFFVKNASTSPILLRERESNWIKQYKRYKDALWEIRRNQEFLNFVEYKDGIQIKDTTFSMQSEFYFFQDPSGNFVFQSDSMIYKFHIDDQSLELQCTLPGSYYLSSYYNDSLVIYLIGYQDHYLSDLCSTFKIKMDNPFNSFGYQYEAFLSKDSTALGTAGNKLYYYGPKLNKDSIYTSIFQLISPDDYRQQSLGLVPNPTSDHFRIIDAQATDHVQIIDLNGRIIYESQVNDFISTHKLLPGLYIVKLYRKDKLLGTSKLVKE